ncbi:MAG TPA: hypothetical protein VLA77_03925 [Candidatus Saccharimonadales bacterium]|nr:hypothetical protein [Candidatus Saccharimonadales bacterium]
MKNTSTKFNFGRGAWTFLAAYIAITILAFGLYLILAAIMGVPTSDPFDIRNDPAYTLAEKLYPILNIFVWVGFAWIYFKKIVNPTIKQAWQLGLFWLAISVPLDLIYFVLIPNPLQVSAYGFYVEQFPWIYLTYIVVAGSPALYVWLKQICSKK